MAGNKTKVDRLHDQLPKFMKTRANTNWSALLDAIGSEDEYLQNLLEDVRKQFFMKTASRPYIDKLGANVKVNRPRFIGMDDPTFRRYVPILAYQPKQVKLIIDTLLDLFFFKESTTSFISTTQASPYYLEDGWELEYEVDGYKAERIEFKTAAFTDINNATAEEIAGAINRQANNSFAIVFSSSVTKEKIIRLFTNTIGSKGSVEIVGGRANVSLQFDGFLSDAGTSNNTQWTVTKVGYTTTMQYTGGDSPGLDQLQVGDIIISNLSNNEGSFIIDEIVASENKIIFENIFSTPGNYTQTRTLDIKFIRPYKSVIYKSDRRAVTWETTPGEITVEMPTTPPVVKRSLRGSAHLNANIEAMTLRNSDTSLTIEDASLWPETGTFVLEHKDTIYTRHLSLTEDTTVTKETKGRLQGIEQRYEYTGKVGNTLTGITPNLPIEAGTYEVNISDATRLSNTLYLTTTDAHNFEVGSYAIIYGSRVANDWNVGTEYTINDLVNYNNSIYRALQGAPLPIDGGHPDSIYDLADLIDGGHPDSIYDPTQLIDGGEVERVVNVGNTPSSTSVWWSEVVKMDGSWKVIKVVSDTQVECEAIGFDMTTGTTGTVRVEKSGLSTNGSILYLKDAILSDDTKIIGPYMWDLDAAYVLSSYTGVIGEDIQPGQIKKILELNTNTIPEEAGEVVFDFGTEREEGPIKYLYKPSDNFIALDPAYVFQYEHTAGSTITKINKRGAHIMSGTGAEYAFYVTNTSTAREILQDVIRDVKSVGIFVEFLIRYPEQLYATLDVYESGNDPG